MRNNNSIKSKTILCTSTCIKLCEVPLFWFSCISSDEEKRGKFGLKPEDWAEWCLVRGLLLLLGNTFWWGGSKGDCSAPCCCGITWTRCFQTLVPHHVKWVTAPVTWGSRSEMLLYINRCERGVTELERAQGGGYLNISYLVKCQENNAGFRFGDISVLQTSRVWIL